MIVFNGNIFVCQHTTLVAPSPSLQSRVANFYGVSGSSEIVSHRGPREISCNLWYTDESATSVSNLHDSLNALSLLVGTHGYLAEYNDAAWSHFPGNEQEFPNCTFVGFQPETIDGQDEPEPVLDPLGFFSETGLSLWVQFGRALWRQTAPDAATGIWRHAPPVTAAPAHP